MSKTALAAIAGVPGVVVIGLLGSLLVLTDPPPAAALGCGPAGPGLSASAAGLGGAVASYRGEQLDNAAAIINAGREAGVNAKAQTIAVMTAMGESSLYVLDHGDAVGPDSRGLFQQRDNGAWGTYRQRMDPRASALAFYDALGEVPGWEQLPPTIAAHRTQRNADPFHYERYWNDAVRVVRALTSSPGAEVIDTFTRLGERLGERISGAIDAPPADPLDDPLGGIAPGTGGLACTGLSPGAITATGWTKPAAGRLSSHYGMRTNPATGEYNLHSGTDLAAACRTPVYAAAGGVVVGAGPSDWAGTLITIDHSPAGQPGIVTRYAHAYPDGVLVRVGDVVKAGQQIARAGSYGNSTGCHLHYEVQRGAQFIDPVPFMRERGAPLG